ncbi:MAG: hypothetical protein HUJ58_07965 [Erysipelotrichaceae bacterium]|nr:hypothetical protein [Erysipelotrichaceae bacterium]
MDKSYLELVQVQKKNKIEGLYPTTKLWILLFFVIWIFILSTIKFTSIQLPLLNLVWIPVLLFMFYISGDFVKCIKACRVILTIAAIIFLAQAFIIPGDREVFRLAFLKVSDSGLKKGFELSTMVLSIAGAFVWVFQTTDNKEIGQALEESGVNYTVSYIFVSTLNMINVLSKNSQTIMNAQRARGVETQGNMIVRAKAFVPSFIPLVLSAITGAEERVLTLESRGFAVKCQKTRVLKLQKSGLEKPAMIVCVIITVLLIAGRVVLWM